LLDAQGQDAVSEHLLLHRLAPVRLLCTLAPVRVVLVHRELHHLGPEAVANRMITHDEPERRVGVFAGTGDTGAQMHRINR
jgi:hypothetical protein